MVTMQFLERTAKLLSMLGAFFTNSKFRTEPYENQRRGSLGTCKTNWKNAICSEEGRRCMGHPYVLDDLLFLPGKVTHWLSGINHVVDLREHMLWFCDLAFSREGICQVQCRPAHLVDG
jgi:hypothetical protein